MDNAGNVSDRKEVNIQIDTTKPTVESIAANPNVSTNQPVTISGKVSDLGSAISQSKVEKVVYSKSSPYGTGLKQSELSSDGSYSFVVNNDEEYKGK